MQNASSVSKLYTNGKELIRTATYRYSKISLQLFNTQKYQCNIEKSEKKDCDYKMRNSIKI